MGLIRKEVVTYFNSYRLIRNISWQYLCSLDYCKLLLIVKTYYHLLGDRSRGYTSKIGVIVLFDGELDIPIDYIVLSKYCHECTSWSARQNKGDISEDQYNIWLTEHSKKCSKNFSGMLKDERYNKPELTNKSFIKRLHNLKYISTVCFSILDYSISIINDKVISR